MILHDFQIQSKCQNERIVTKYIVMLFVKNIFQWFIIFTVFQRMTKCQRKIKDGAKTEDFKKYMVYLLKAKESPKTYDEWLCGGTIVTNKIIITSAACVMDVEYMYAIAGYNKYVNFKDIDNDDCTKAAKKKIVRSCVPIAYDFAYDAPSKWSEIDIATVEVETPYDFSAAILPGCTHTPAKIAISYDAKYQKPKTDVFTLGWGHQGSWREANDTRDLNAEQLIYGSTLILEKEECKNLYDDEEMLPSIDKYMICTLERGSLNDKGRLIDENFQGNATGKGCRRRDGKCDDNTKRKSGNLNHRKKHTKQKDGKQKLAPNSTLSVTKLMGNPSKKVTQKKSKVKTRKQGICQNDHGGPLVTWRGTEEILIGVASTFQIDQDSVCAGPFLFTSTHCNSMFLDCVIHGGKHVQRMGEKGDYTYFVGSPPEKTDPYYYYDYGQVYDSRRETGEFCLDEAKMAPACQRPAAELGFEFEFRRINWDDPQRTAINPRPRIRVHRPAEEQLAEEIKIRPQIPIRQYSLFTLSKGLSKGP